MAVSFEVEALSRAFPEGIYPANCPTRELLDHVTGKWGILILTSLADGPHRWSELRRRIGGISEKVLAQTLRTLEADGLVHREAQPVIPPRVDYSLTPDGEELAGLVMPLLAWAAARVGPPTPHAGS